MFSLTSTYCKSAFWRAVIWGEEVHGKVKKTARFQLSLELVCSSTSLSLSLIQKDQRGGWPLRRIVETEVNGDSKSTNERGPSLVGSLAHRGGTRNLYHALAALVSPVQIFFFSHRTLFQFMYSHRPATRESSLSLNLCLRSYNS